MMFCKNCGTKKISMEQRFCRSCGVEFIRESNMQYSFIQSENKTILSQSISKLKENIYTNILPILGIFLFFILLSSIENIQNIPYIYIIFKIIESVVILLVTMKILLPTNEFKNALVYHNNYIVIWIVSLISICIAVEIIDGMLTTIGNSMLNNIDYYSQQAFINKFNISMLLIEFWTVDISVTIVTYLIGFKIFNFIKNNLKVSFKEAFKNLKVNISSIITVFFITNILGFLNGYLLSSKPLIEITLGISIVFVWLSLTINIAYFNVENVKLYEKENNNINN